MAQIEDWADRHVARWRDHWVGIEFDEETEAIFVRLMRIVRYVDRTSKDAIAQSGLHDFEYKTLHHLMIRETPGHASPSALAEDLGISPAGMTGRLDGLEKAGWIKRIASPDDRRRVDIEITRAGLDIWRRAMDLRGDAERSLADVLSKSERAQLAALLKKLTLHIESGGS